ncbi:MAG TPA: antitermination protein NusG, partial [Gammaproteobacteria bacterium]|nr:antitermination protein NusG [Gammaproteobacteria bacterium]
TFLTGLVLLYNRHSGLTTDIVIGATLGTLMFLNVWGIIWRNQKVVIASNQSVAAGGEPDP